MGSPLFEFKGNSEIVNKPIKVDQVDKSSDQVSNSLIHLHDSAVVPITKNSSNDTEQNVQNSLLEYFDSEDEIVVPPASVQTKAPKWIYIHIYTNIIMLSYAYVIMLW